MFPWDRDEGDAAPALRSGRRSLAHAQAAVAVAGAAAAAAGAAAAAPPVVATIELARPFDEVPLAQQLRELADEADACGLDCREVYGKGELMQTFEAEVAQHVGKPAACFVPSGVMAQQIALCVHHAGAGSGAGAGGATAGGGSGAGSSSGGGGGSSSSSSSKSVLLHPSSHLLIHEQDAVRELLGFEVLQAGARDAPLTLADVRAALGAREAQCLPPPTALVLEVPHRELGGWNTPLEDLRAISALCRARGVALHMDGARLWDTAASPHFGFGAGGVVSGLRALAALFDSVYVSFYKGLGGPVGAMLLGGTGFVAASRVWLRRFGGNLYTMAPFVLANRKAFHALKGSFGARTARLAQVVAAVGEALGGAQQGQRSLIRFVPPVPECAQVHVYLAGSCAVLDAARDATIVSHGISVFDRTRGPGVMGDGSEQCFEWKMGPRNMAIPTEAFVEGWLAFVQHLAAGC